MPSSRAFCCISHCKETLLLDWTLIHLDAAFCLHGWPRSASKWTNLSRVQTTDRRPFYTSAWRNSANKFTWFAIWLWNHQCPLMSWYIYILLIVVYLSECLQGDLVQHFPRIEKWGEVLIEIACRECNLLPRICTEVQRPNTYVACPPPLFLRRWCGLRVITDLNLKPSPTSHALTHEPNMKQHQPFVYCKMI